MNGVMSLKRIFFSKAFLETNHSNQTLLQVGIHTSQLAVLFKVIIMLSKVNSL